MDFEKILIPKEISLDEPCLRCIYSPLQYSRGKNKLKPNAVLPPPNRGRKEVSLSRLNYIKTIDVCIDRGKEIKMGDNLFCGVASVTKRDVNEVNDEVSTDLQADIVYAPMHLEEYVDAEINIYVADPNVDKGDHAELQYNHNYDSDDVVYTAFRKYASKLTSKMKIVYLSSDEN